VNRHHVLYKQSVKKANSKPTSDIALISRISEDRRINERINEQIALLRERDGV